jgi:hypothetical protein
MKKITSALAVVTLAGAALASGFAQAAVISQPPQTITLATGANYFGHAIAMGNEGNTFADRYNFSTSVFSDFGSVVSAFSPGLVDGIQITGLSLFNSAGMSLGGIQVLDGEIDLWKLATAHLAADSYYLLVSGKVLAATPTGYGGSLTVSAVPEADAYAMLLAGLGVVGYLARRRRGGAAAPL